MLKIRFPWQDPGDHYAGKRSEEPHGVDRGFRSGAAVGDCPGSQQTIGKRSTEAGFEVSVLRASRNNDSLIHELLTLLEKANNISRPAVGGGRFGVCALKETHSGLIADDPALTDLVI